ncbi:transcription cofactor vestigial-like protein 4 isoform X1 [Oncorhynchus nerka]|uniref:transcription cofactor vestigial-like protein 4 isoform X1 n=1 Tax=Oncorhynchus nerka TaxID=8023 RepID=UPI001130BE25|nr:transcription cofactor vestigial-like protein 4 isoform X1 [Oncorhynchus nerka]
MLYTRMDLLNYQFLDKMNNNIGRLHYEAESSLTGESRIPSLPSAMTNMRTGPPPICSSKRKYGEEQVDDRIDCDNDHMTKMSRLFAAQLGRPAGGDNRSDPWSLGHSSVEHITSSSNCLHDNHLYASIPSYGLDQPLALTKNSLESGLGGAERPAMPGPVDRPQNRPSVITCAPASNRNCYRSHCHKSHSPSPPIDQRKANANTAVDPVIEEHFRRSLGKNYKEPEPISNSVSITGSVDDHFAKALGKTWLQIKAKGPGGGPHSPEANS